MSDAWLAIGENRAEWVALTEALDLADFFQLHVVQLADASLEGAFLASLADALGSRWDGFVRSTLRELLVEIPLDAAFRSRLSGAAGWCLTSGGVGRSGVALAAAILNQRRDVIRELLSGPMVAALHPEDWRIVRGEAADLWSVHVAVSRFSAAPLANSPRFPLLRTALLLEWERVRGAEPTTASARERRRS